MEEEVIDNADKSVKQQASARYQNTLLEGGKQRRIDDHVDTARSPVGGKVPSTYIRASRQGRGRGIIHTWKK